VAQMTVTSLLSGCVTLFNSGVAGKTANGYSQVQQARYRPFPHTMHFQAVKPNRREPMPSEPNSVRLFYLRDENRRALAVIASKTDGDKVKYALAICNPKDEFRKEAGRKIAIERLECTKPNNKYVRTVTGGDGSGFRVLADIVHDTSVPARIRAAADLEFGSAMLRKQQREAVLPSAA
jgi:hypothetical protein